MVFSTQLPNVIGTTTQNYYLQQHYCHNDLVYRSSIKNTNNIKARGSTNRNRKWNRNIRKHKKTSRNKYQSNSKNFINLFTSIQNGYNNSKTKTKLNSSSNVCVCVKVEHFLQINSYRKKIGVYFEEKFINLQLVLVIILLALITCTAQNINTQVKSQQKPMTSPEFLVTALRGGASTTTAISFNNIINAMCIHHRIKYILNLYTRKENSFKFQTKIFDILSHNRNHHCSKNDPTNMQFISREISYKLLTHNKTSFLKNNFTTTKTEDFQPKSNIYSDDDAYNKNYKPHNEVSIGFSKLQRNTKYSNLEAIKLESKSPGKDGQSHQFEIKSWNINLFKNKSANYKTNKNVNILKKVNKTVENVHHNFNDLDDHHIEMKSMRTELNLLTLSANRSLNFFNAQQHEREKLLKFVLDGLGLQNVPNMAYVNISQKEYVTKYREYLQRVRSRKLRKLSETEEHLFRPLQILSIINQKTFLNQNRVHNRRRRNALIEISDNFNRTHQNHEIDNDHSLEKRVKNILRSKKQYEEPRSKKKERDARKSNIRLRFALKPKILKLKSDDIEEANIRLILIRSPSLVIKTSKIKNNKAKSGACGLSRTEDQPKLQKNSILKFKLFFLPSRGERLLLNDHNIAFEVDHKKLEQTRTQWVQFDVTKAVKASIDAKRLNHILLELQCDNCKNLGVRMLNGGYNTAVEALLDDSSTTDNQLMPVLNIIGHFEQSQYSIRAHQYESQNVDRNKEITNHSHYHNQEYNNNNNSYNRRANCYKKNQRCCRHSMEVIFKEIKGFEFIIQPKVFDAGYCHGRCPPRYNPANHHALLQSLIWKQNHRKTTRPCCAPSKLIELEVLHIDEKDSNKLKISTWSDMKVVECACS